jgi:hypothetical protein
MRSWPAPINRTTRAGTTPSQGAQIRTFLIADVRGYTLEYEEPFVSLLGFTQGSNCGAEGI